MDGVSTGPDLSHGKALPTPTTTNCRPVAHLARNTKTCCSWKCGSWLVGTWQGWRARGQHPQKAATLEPRATQVWRSSWLLLLLVPTVWHHRAGVFQILSDVSHPKDLSRKQPSTVPLVSCRHHLAHSINIYWFGVGGVTTPSSSHPSMTSPCPVSQLPPLFSVLCFLVCSL